MRRGGLGNVADQRHRAVQRPPGDHPQRHRRLVLAFVHHDVAVGTHLGVAAALARARPGPQHRVGLVEHGHVGVAPLVVGLAVAPGAEQLLSLGVGQHPVGRRPQQRTRAVEVAQQLCGRQQRPHALERLHHIGMTREPFAQLGRLGAAAVRGRHGRIDRLLHVRPARVVMAETAAGLGHDGPRRARRQRDVPQAELETQIAADRPLPVAHSVLHHLRHADIALDARHVGRVGQAHPHVGEDLVEQVGQHEQVHTGFAQAGQHPFHVAQEEPVGPHHEHALPGQREPVRVQQVGGAVQRHDGLAGAGTALCDQDPLARAADDLVLLGLDRGHHLAQLAVAALFERCVQRPVGVQPGARVVAPLAVERIEVEELVFEVGKHAAAAHEVPPSQQAERVATGGPEERLGDRGPPVHHYRLLALVGHRKPADVEGLAGAIAVRTAVGLVSVAVRQRGPVDAAEHQRRRAELQLAQAPCNGVFDDVAFEAGLPCAASTHLDHVAQPRRPLPGRLQQRVGTVDMSLFCLDFRMAHAWLVTAFEADQGYSRLVTPPHGRT